MVLLVEVAAGLAEATVAVAAVVVPVAAAALVIVALEAAVDLAVVLVEAVDVAAVVAAVVEPWELSSTDKGLGMRTLILLRIATEL
jgi:hypothetical protein